MATISANGELKEIELPVDLSGFLTQQGLIPSSVVVERNGEAVPPSQFSQLQLQDGDRLEIVRIVAGG
jgi:sulfur carrier protein